MRSKWQGLNRRLSARVLFGARKNKLLVEWILGMMMTQRVH